MWFRFLSIFYFNNFCALIIKKTKKKNKIKTKLMCHINKGIRILFPRIDMNCWLLNLLVNMDLTRALIIYTYKFLYKWCPLCSKYSIDWLRLFCGILWLNQDVYCLIMWKFDINELYILFCGHLCAVIFLICFPYNPSLMNLY